MPRTEWRSMSTLNTMGVLILMATMAVCQDIDVEPEENDVGPVGGRIAYAGPLRRVMYERPGRFLPPIDVFEDFIYREAPSLETDHHWNNFDTKVTRTRRHHRFRDPNIIPRTRMGDFVMVPDILYRRRRR